MSNLNDDAFTELVLRVLDGLASPEERATLKAELESNPDRRSSVVSICRLHGRLGEALSADHQKQIFQAEEPRKSTRRSTARRRPQGPGNPWVVPAFVAAGILAAGLLYLLLGPTQHDPAPLRPDVRRREAEAKLQAIEEKRQALTQTPVPPSEPPVVKEKREQDLQALQREKERIEQELRDATPTAPKPVPQEAPRVAEKPPDPPPVKQESATQVAVAEVVDVAGDVFATTKDGKSPLAAGATLNSTQGVETGGGKSRIVLRFADKTRVEIGPESSVTEFRLDAGKRILLAKGSIAAEVAKQPKDQPMIFATPHGEAKVLGTTLRLFVGDDAVKGTRLDVDEGKVELKKLAGKSALVESGHYAVAAAGAEPVSRLQDPPALRWLEILGEVTISFGPEGRRLPQGVVIDSGEPFDAKRSYGWAGPNVKDAKIPGKPELEFRRRVRLEGDEGDIRAARIAAGWEQRPTESWSAKLPKGRYLVTVCIGRRLEVSGPNYLQLQEIQVLDAATTQLGQHLEKEVPIELKDGLLKMVVGGVVNHDTALNFIRIRKAAP